MNRILSRRAAALLLLASALAPAQMEAAPRVPRELLITATSIGPARLGMSVSALKRAFPGSRAETQDGPTAFFVLKKNGREILIFTTRELGRDINARLRDSDTVSSLRTSDPLFRTRVGIGPGSWLHNAARLYGRPTLSFWTHGEEAVFPRLSRKISFDIEAPPVPGSDMRVAGIYTPAQIRAISGVTTRFRSGARTTAIGCAQ